MPPGDGEATEGPFLHLLSSSWGLELREEILEIHDDVLAEESRPSHESGCIMLHKVHQKYIMHFMQLSIRS